MLKNIPKVDKVMDWPEIKGLLEENPRPVVLEAVRRALDMLRGEALRGTATEEDFAEKSVTDRVRVSLDRANAPGLRRVINATGVILHTNLGRAPISESLRESMLEAAFGYSTLEFDLEMGVRGHRAIHVEKLVQQLTGAEAAVVVNNNAAAVMLALTSLAKGREVIVSRGELVEIGGSFRIPEVMEQSGAILREVGATNKTHLRDYRSALNTDTALLLKVHTSNFAMVGFTAEVSVEEMAALGRESSLPVMVDAGSGCLVDLAARGIPGERTVRDYLVAGADLVTFSGDKLLGGPQAGIIVGKRALVDPMKKHPLLRALRVDKVTLAALEGTLRLYRDERLALSSIPTLRMLTMSDSELVSRASTMVRRMRRALPSSAEIRTLRGTSPVGGGSYPLLEIPSTLVSVSIPGLSPRQLEEKMRTGNIPVIGRIAHEKYLLDPRTLLDGDIADIIDAIRTISESPR